MFRRLLIALPKYGKRTGAAGCSVVLGWSLFGSPSAPENPPPAKPLSQRDISWWSSDGKRKPNPERYPEANAPSPVEEIAVLTLAPEVPPPITRTHPVHLLVNMEVLVKQMPIDSIHTFEYWTFNGGVPGPFIRARQGDVMTVTLDNQDLSGMLHNIDFHAVQGPGGGSHVLTAESGEKKRATFKLCYPGLFIYHCAVDPTGVHMTNGMFGLILVEPEAGLPKVDKEFYVVQHELYTMGDGYELDLDEDAGREEMPTHIVFNGRDGSLREGGALKAKAGDRVRLFFGNAGPNLVSSFHVIGAIFDNVYRDGDLISPPGHGVQTTLVPAGGASICEFNVPVPGTFALVDHSIFRIEKGAAGWLQVSGDPRPDLYHSQDPPNVCADCVVHP